MKTYNRHELTNEQYQAINAASGSALHVIYESCEAVYKFAKRKETDTFTALDFGTAFHCALIEPDKFPNEFTRGFDASKHPDALRTIPDIKKHITDNYGKPKGISSMTKPQLIAWLHDAGDKVEIIDALEAEHAAKHAGKEIIPAEHYDDIMTMVAQIRADETMANMLDNSIIEQSFVGDIDGIPCRTRPDIIIPLDGGEYAVLNLKSTADVRPEGFGRLAYNCGYLLKEAFTYDLLTQHYGKPPKWIGFLAQQKKPAGYEEYPFIWKPYYLTSYMIEAGRAMYQSVLPRWQEMVEKEKYPAYGTDLKPLELPGWAKAEIFNKFGISED